MRRLLALVRGLPVDSTVARRLHAAPRADEPKTVKAAAPKPTKVDYDALRALGGQIVKVPRR